MIFAYFEIRTRGLASQMPSKWEVHLNLKPKIHFILHFHLPKTREEGYKVYPLALSLCASTHSIANARDNR